MLIDKNYFIGEILIPNLVSYGNGASASVSKANEDLLMQFIVKYERSFLIKLFGIEMYNEFIDGQDSKWERLKLELADSYTHSSPIADYVYYWFVRNRMTKTVGVGEIEGQANNATVVSPANKMISAWNSMVDGIERIVRWIESHREDYPDFRPDFTADIFFKINAFGI